jgi:hypothetical protein
MISSNKKLLLIQPGAYGDLIVCAPIAKWYADKGYEVYWPIRKKFKSVLKEFSYVTPVILNEKILHSDWLRSDVLKILPTIDKYNKILNLADRGTHPYAQMPDESFEQCKYRLAEVPFEEKHTLEWNRNKKKEDEIYDRYVKSLEYVFVHNTSSGKEKVSIPTSVNKPVVFCDNPEGYNIFDWYKVAINASEIYCTESAIWAFLDGIVKDITKERYLLPRNKMSGSTVSYYWKKEYLK